MKKFYKYIAVVAIAATAGFTAYSTQGNKLHLSSLAIENVEALARGESGGGADPNVSYGRGLTDCYEDGVKVGTKCMPTYPQDECKLSEVWGRCPYI